MRGGPLNASAQKTTSPWREGIWKGGSSHLPVLTELSCDTSQPSHSARNFCSSFKPRGKKKHVQIYNTSLDFRLSYYFLSTHITVCRVLLRCLRKNKIAWWGLRVCPWRRGQTAAPRHLTLSKLIAMMAMMVVMVAMVTVPSQALF